MKSVFLLCFLIISKYCFAQDSTTLKFLFSDSHLVFTQPVANLAETRVGLIKDFSTSNIRLDIGFSPDVVYFGLNSPRKEIFSLGADFHAFGLISNKSEKIILQVFAIDAIFGGHLSYKRNFGERAFSAKFCILHLSSHLVDGAWNDMESKWKNDKKPEPFGREYIEFFASYYFSNISLFLGTNYIFRQRPNVLTKFNFEFATNYELKNFISEDINCYLGYDFKLSGFNKKYFGNNNFEVGIGFGKQWGMRLFLMYYSGKNYYGEYFTENLSYLGTGFNIFFL